MFKFAAVAVLISFSLLLSSCNNTQQESISSSRDEEQPIISVGVSFADFNDNYYSLIMSELSEIDYDDNSLKIEFLDAAGDSNQQQDDIQYLISLGVDVVAVNLIDESYAESVCNYARAAEIQVLFFGAKPLEAGLPEYDNYVYLHINEADLGTLQAQMAISDFNTEVIADKNGDGVLQYLLLKGELENPITAERSEAVVASLNTINSSMIAEANTDWSTDSARKQCEAWQESAELLNAEAIFCNSDGIALGVIEMLKEYELSIPVYGIDAIPQAIDIIDDGQLMGTVYNDPYEMAEAISMVAANMARGYELVESTALTAVSPTEVTVPVAAIKPTS